MKLRTRIALVAAAAVALAVAAASVVAFTTSRRSLIAEIDRSLVERANQFARNPVLAAFQLSNRRLGPGRVPDDPFGRGEASFDALYFQAIDNRGVIYIPLGQRLRLPVTPEDAAAVASGDAVLRTVEVEGLRLRMITVPVGEDVLQLARALSEADAILRTMAVAQWSTGIAGILVAAVLGLIVARSALRPVAQLTEKAEDVARTLDLEERIEIDRSDEIGRLAASFNAMLAALAESRAQQHRLVRDAGHELRTPLTSLRTNIEVLARAGDMDPEERERLLADLTEEVGELGTLVDELVQLATDTRDDEPIQSDLALDELVEQVADRYRRRTGRTIDVDAEPTAVDGRPGLLARAIGNLLDNAHKWSPPDAAIRVRVRGGAVVVEDQGPGIPLDERERVFARFYRTAAARGMPGSGLGLAIVDQIVSLHGGEVSVGEAPGGGAAVGFRLPGAR